MKFFETQFDVLLNLDKIISLSLDGHQFEEIHAKDVTGNNHLIVRVGSHFIDNQGNSVDFSYGLKSLFLNILTIVIIKFHLEENRKIITWNTIYETTWDKFLHSCEFKYKFKPN